MHNPTQHFYYPMAFRDDLAGNWPLPKGRGDKMPSPHRGVVLNSRS